MWMCRIRVKLFIRPVIQIQEVLFWRVCFFKTCFYFDIDACIPAGDAYKMVKLCVILLPGDILLIRILVHFVFWIFFPCEYFIPAFWELATLFKISLSMCFSRSSQHAANQPPIPSKQILYEFLTKIYSSDSFIYQGFLIGIDFLIPYTIFDLVLFSEFFNFLVKI